MEIYKTKLEEFKTLIEEFDTMDCKYLGTCLDRIQHKNSNLIKYINRILDDLEDIC